MDHNGIDDSTIPSTNVAPVPVNGRMPLPTLGDQDHITCMARTIYGEARGEYKKLSGGLAPLMAVGNVIMNRFQAQPRYGDDVTEVCLKPYQFSCWNGNDPNREIILKVDENDKVFKICIEISTHLFKNEWPDLTKGSTHYHTASIKPDWSENWVPRVRIGSHIFYRE